MSTKPTSLPIWATDSAAQVTEPNLAKKQQGHVGGEPLFGDYENWYKRLVYLWTEYLRDGAFSGDHSIDGDLNVQGALSAGEIDDLQDQITALNNALTETRIRGGGSAYGIGLAVGTTGGVDLNATADAAFYDLDAPVGRKLTAIRARIVDNATGPTTVTIELFSKPDVSLVSTGFSATSLGNGTAQTLSIAVPDLLIAAGTNYVLRATVSAANTCSVRRVEFDWRR